MRGCQVENCTQPVTKPDHVFCRDHWKAERAGHVRQCSSCRRWQDNGGAKCSACERVGLAQPLHSHNDPAELESPAGYLSSTRIGRHFGLSNIRTNLILAELGWVEKYVKGWVPTDRGNGLGANVREMRNGTPYVVWPEAILNNPVLRQSVNEQTAANGPAAASALTAAGPNVIDGASRPNGSPPSTEKGSDFRSRFPANFRTQDGHMVRSRAEVLIDNWLYMQGIVHAYERRLPIEEECYCDFYLPRGQGVYIEFWGRESDPKYRDRKAVKQAIYAKHRLRLIELGDAEIERLDDVLPRMLLRFGIESV